MLLNNKEDDKDDNKDDEDDNKDDEDDMVTDHTTGPCSLKINSRLRLSPDIDQ